MTDPFEYDVFISFSSVDEEIVKPIWQELCSNGLRVFWSDATLKKEIGTSWFEVIEKSLERSRHMLLVCSDNSMNSKWVQREYRAFFDYCYSPNSRRLIPLLTREFSPKNLPLFLREFQVGKISDSNFIHEIIPILGGVNIEQLQQELKSLQEQVNLLSLETELLNKNIQVESNKVSTLVEENKALKKEVIQLREQNSLLSKTSKEQERSLSLNEINIQKLQQERLSLQEKINSLLTASKAFEENAKIEANNASLLIEENTSLLTLNGAEKNSPTERLSIESLDSNKEPKSSSATKKGKVREIKSQEVTETARILHDVFYRKFSCSECGCKGLSSNTKICPQCKRKFV